jgi:hypothetical protein
MGGKRTLAAITSAMMSLVRPDGFAISLFVVGIIMLFVPMMLMPGLVAMLAAVACWLVMVVVKAVSRRGT